MIARRDCERVRRALPELLDGRPEPAVSAHLGSCAACAAEVAGLRSIVDEAVDSGVAEVPDPGEGYWEGFLPGVRTRLAAARVPRAGAASFGSLPAAAAARAAAAVILVAASGLAGWLATGPTGTADDAAAASKRFEEALARVSAPAADEVLLQVGLAGRLDDPTISLAATTAADVTAEEIINAIESIECPAGASSLCREEELQRLLDGLDDQGACRMKDELSAELG